MGCHDGSCDRHTSTTVCKDKPPFTHECRKKPAHLVAKQQSVYTPLRIQDGEDLLQENHQEHGQTCMQLSKLSVDIQLTSRESYLVVCQITSHWIVVQRKEQKRKFKVITSNIRSCTKYYGLQLHVVISTRGNTHSLQSLATRPQYSQISSIHRFIIVLHPLK